MHVVSGGVLNHDCVSVGEVVPAMVVLLLLSGDEEEGKGMGVQVTMCDKQAE